jgi:hypothetical protein
MFDTRRWGKASRSFELPRRRSRLGPCSNLDLIKLKNYGALLPADRNGVRHQASFAATLMRV